MFGMADSATVWGRRVKSSAKESCGIRFTSAGMSLSGAVLRKWGGQLKVAVIAELSAGVSITV